MMKLINWYRTNYRIWKRFKTFPAGIQATGRWPSETYMKYPPASTFNGLKVLNFGCGKSVYTASNVVNADVVPGNSIKVINPKKPLTQLGTDFDLIIANHVLEHVPNWFEAFKQMASMLKPGGILEVWIPPISSDSAFSYRDHINRIGLLSFSGCASMPNAGHNALAAVEFKELGDVANLEVIKVAKRPIVKWWTMLAWPSLLEWMTSYLRNVVSEEQFVFRKVK